MYSRGCMSALSVPGRDVPHAGRRGGHRSTGYVAPA